ncbi:MAG: SMI1/KNR4 family protein [Deltaproteobacteria bacterium]
MLDYIKRDCKKNLNEHRQSSIFCFLMLFAVGFSILSGYFSKAFVAAISFAIAFILFTLFMVLNSYLIYLSEMSKKKKYQETLEKHQALLNKIASGEIPGLECGPPMAEQEISALEKEIGISLPDSYKMFLSIVGELKYQPKISLDNSCAYIFGSRMLEKTIILRRKSVIPNNFLLLTPNYFMDTSSLDPLTGEYNIVLWDGAKAKIMYHNFYDFLQEIRYTNQMSRYGKALISIK